MKLLNNYFLIILINFLSLLNVYAQSDINKLFFNLPLESNRDTIYSSIKKYGFIEKKSNRTVSQDDKIIKTFYGYLDIKVLKNNLADSIKIQLTSGIRIVENEKYYQSLLIVLNYHHFTNIENAKNFYQSIKKELNKITSKKPYHYKYFEDDKKIYFSDTFLDTENDREISIEFKNVKQEYIVIIEYQRNEGEKKLQKQFIKKRELVYREIDNKNLYQSYNVEQIPIIKKCSINNRKSIECFKNSIINQIMEDVNFGNFGLTNGTHIFFLSFIIDKNTEIINIKVIHPNEKICEDIIKSINEIDIIEPALKNGIAVDYLAKFPLKIGLED